MMIATDLDLSISRPPESDRRWQSARRRLTGREMQVLQLLRGGLKDREIAAALGISVRTAEKHVEHILRKLPARNRADAARLDVAALSVVSQPS
jgi:DNA-binding NarL/FixJ family response regulator